MTEQQDLGHKRTCPHCGTKYYDFYQDELDCPECGKTIDAVNITKPWAQPENEAENGRYGAVMGRYRAIICPVRQGLLPGYTWR